MKYKMLAAALATFGVFSFGAIAAEMPKKNKDGRTLEQILRPFLRDGGIKEEHITSGFARQELSTGETTLIRIYNLDGLKVVTETKSLILRRHKLSSGEEVIDAHFHRFPRYIGVDLDGNGKIDRTKQEVYIDLDEGRKGINGNEILFEGDAPKQET